MEKVCFLNLGVLLTLVHLLYNKINLKKVAFVPILLSIMALCIVSIALQQGERCLRIRGDCSPNIEAARLLENEGKKLFITDLSVGANASNALTILLETKAKDLDVMSVSSTSDVLRLIPENKYDKIYLYGTALEIEPLLKEGLGDQMVLIFQRARFRFWELALP